MLFRSVKVLFELILKTVYISILLHTVKTIATARIQNFDKTQMCNCKSQEYFTSSIFKIVKALFELILKTVHISIVLHTLKTIATARIQNFEKKQICNFKSQEYFTSSILKIVKVLFELIMKTVHVSIVLHTVVTIATARIKNF